MQQRTTLGELSTPFIKYVVWSPDMSSVALLSKHAIIIANKRLGGACTVHETIRVKVPRHPSCLRASFRNPSPALECCAQSKQWSTMSAAEYGI